MSGADPDEPAGSEPQAGPPWPPPGPDTAWWRGEGISPTEPDAPAPVVSGPWRTPAVTGNNPVVPRVVSPPPDVIAAAPGAGKYSAIERPAPRRRPSESGSAPVAATVDADAVNAADTVNAGNTVDAAGGDAQSVTTGATAAGDTAASPRVDLGTTDVTTDAADDHSRELAVRGKSDLEATDVAEHEPLAISSTAAEVAVDQSSLAGSKNAAPTGFPTHRTPSARSSHRTMPATASPAEAAARSAAARSAAAAGGQRAGARADSSTETGRIVSPRHEAGEAASALAMFFNPDSTAATAESVWPQQMMGVPTGHRADAPVPSAYSKPIKDPRSPAVGLTALVIFAFIATFFAWFSAGPLWLTLGHAHHGTATVANCPVGGIDARCAEFKAAGDSFTATVTLLGPAANEAHRGSVVPAEMVSSDATTAYAGDARSLYLRWVPGLAIVLLCGFGIAWSTGTFRLASRRARSLSLIASIGGPILLAAGMLAITW